MNDIAPFQPENYPRIYKKKIEVAVYGYIMAGTAAFFATFCLITVAIKYHGSFSAGGACSGLGVIGSILFPIGLLVAKAPYLKLTLDAIEYRGMGSFYIFTRRMRRDDIKGVSSINVSYGVSYGGGYHSAGTTFMPKDEKASALFVPEGIFPVDEAYDAWVAGFPYLGGLYNQNGAAASRFGTEDFFRVEWRDHRWMPRKGERY